MNQDFEFPEELQVDILSLIIKNYDTWLKYNKVLKPKYFSEYQAQDIYQATAKFAKKYKELPKQSVLTNLVDESITGSKKFIAEYTDTIKNLYTRPLNVKYLEDTILNFVKVQHMKAAVSAAYNKLDDGAAVLKIVENAISSTADIEFDAGYNYKEKAKERAEKRDAGIRVYNQVPTGIGQLDEVMAGGPGGGELACIVAEPNRGKSIILVNFALNAALLYGKNVLYFSLGDMSASNIGERLDGCLCKYNKEELKVKKDKFEYKVSTLDSEIYIKFFPQNQATVEDLKTHAVNLMKIKGIDIHLIIVDMAEYVKSSIRGEERQRLRNIYLNLHGLSGELGIPFWTAHQANVFNSNGKPVRTITGKHLAEAKVVLLGICDLIASANQTVEEEAVKPDEEMRFYIIRQRDGKRGEILNTFINKEKFIIKDNPKNLRNPSILPG